MSSPSIQSSDDREEETKEPPLFEIAMSKFEVPLEGVAAADKVVKKEKRQVDWPMENIKEPHENDVLCGRGARSNHHPGNKRYRKMVEDRKLEYVNCKPQDKSRVAFLIIQVWRAQQPPGRFLTKNKETGLWLDVGDKKARKKTSQALRENAPLIRKQQEDEKLAADRGEDDSDYEEGEDGKSSRFVGGTNMDADGVSETRLVRDHTFGREYLNEGDFLTLDGFSWQAPCANGGENSDPSTREGHPGAYVYLNPHLDPQPGSPGPPFRCPSHASLSPPPSTPPPEARANMTSEDPLYASPQGYYESWGHISPLTPGCAYPQHSRNWTNGYPSRRRENSLGQNPLPRAIDQTAAYLVFDSRTDSWSPLPAGYCSQMDHHADGGPQYPPGRPHTLPPIHNRPPPVTSCPGHSHGYTPSSSSGPSSPSYSVDPTVASAWSRQDPMAIAKTWSTGSNEDSDRFRSLNGSWPRSTISEKHATPPRPDIIKHATSSQNETIETKPGLRGPSVKRAALNRDNSMASNRLKETCVPGLRKPFNLDREMRQLSASLRQTSISGLKPKPMSEEDKQSTIDLIAMDLMVKPLRLSAEARSSTIEALGLDLDDAPFLRPELIERGKTMEEVFKELRDGVPKPPGVSLLDRLTTNDLTEILNEPIGEEDGLFSFSLSAGDIGD